MGKKILVVGGAGYIGSHMAQKLMATGEKVVVLDNLSGGYPDAVLDADFVHGDIADDALMDKLLSGGDFDTVMHFASFIQVGESVIQPGKYYQNNVANTVHLLNSMVRHSIPFFVFSSTAAIFGEPQYVPIDEAHPQVPLNPYGKSKWLIEQMLPDYEQAYGMRSVCLRYFNAAGAHPDGLLGERHEPETHLIPLALRAAAGRLQHLTLFGSDYDTPDGTCIRDYIHVSDLCDAHLLAIEYLRAGGRSEQFNLGNGAGYSVSEVINCVEQVTGKIIPLNIAARREGDPVRLVADSYKAKTVLGWQPKFLRLDEIISHAWVWEQRYQ